MKKKLSLIILMCLVSAALFLLGKNFQESNKTKTELATQVSVAQQNITADKVDKTEKNKTEDSSLANKNTNQPNEQTNNISTTKNTTSDNSKTGTTVNNNVNAQVKQTPQAKANITVVDTISGKIIIAKAAEINGLTVANATFKLLDSANISYKTSGFGDTIYFSSINGLRERGEGALSGWCFYVNGKKPNIGAGAYKLNKDDILEWKYLKDGGSDN